MRGIWSAASHHLRILTALGTSWCFHALGTLAGGVGAPLLFGLLIQTHSRIWLGLGYGLGALLMLIAQSARPASA